MRVFFFCVDWLNQLEMTCLFQILEWERRRRIDMGEKKGKGVVKKKIPNRILEGKTNSVTS